ncbi:signal peptidase I [Secundilactobacillus kimchicus]|uniref:Signal peptidase I n=1 Tax=Secundilactobacillus kimchicus JCM 15530 TaxID=1302272 RepID=A0A0R1HL58_9LACO|nr:signal peptidase I [Secundilactobacillus kimchicus]KRK47445.1 putative signal peptidase I [Secundilactobacillus kimchicus JCM 15530]
MKQIPKRVRLTLIPIVLGLFVALFIHHFIAQPVKVTDNDMAPNLRTGQTVWLSATRKPHRFDVVLVVQQGVTPTTPQSHYTMLRVIGMPGDTVAYKAGLLYLNGHKTTQSFLSHTQQSNGTSQFDWDLVSLSQSEGWIQPNTSYKVPANHYFLMGDNRQSANDSRHIGFIPRNAIRGVVRLAPWQGWFQRHHNINNAS